MLTGTFLQPQSVNNMKKLLLLILAVSKLTLASTQAYVGNMGVFPYGVCLDSTTCNNYLGNQGSDLILQNGGSGGLEFWSNGTQRFQITTAGVLLVVGSIPLKWNTDAGGAIGATGANRPNGMFSAGDISIEVLGKTFHVAEGTNGCKGQATLSSGTVTVSTTCTGATSDDIFLTNAGGGGVNLGSVSVGTVVASTSFVINSSNVADTSNVNWMIIKH